MQKYDKIDWEKNYRKNKKDYVIGEGSFGVLKYQPYKDEILPCWTFNNIKSSKKSAKKIYRLFKYYIKTKDFPGADIARKYLRMGVKKALGYSSYTEIKNQKINKDKWEDPEKYEIYIIFKKYYDKVVKNKQYIHMMKLHLKKH